VIVICGNEGFNKITSSALHLICSNHFETIGIKMNNLHDVEQLIKIIKEIKSKRQGIKIHGIGF
jgi:hypothetical protein